MRPGYLGDFSDRRLAPGESSVARPGFKYPNELMRWAVYGWYSVPADDPSEPVRLHSRIDWRGSKKYPFGRGMPDWMSLNGLDDLDPERKKTLQILVRQAARWATAATQDANSMIAVLHANYGAAYLWALQDIASSQEIEQATGIDLKKFKQEILKVQDGATRKMAKLCPKFAPPKTYLTKAGGEGG